MPAFIIALLIGLGAAGGGAAYAANGALPGDALYPVKQAVESVQVATERSAEGRAARHLALAQEKLKEIEALRGRKALDKGIAEATAAFAEHQAAVDRQLKLGSVKGKDVEALVAKLQANAARHQDVLNRVLDQVPDQAKDAIRHAMEVSQRGLTNAVDQQTGPAGANE